MLIKFASIALLFLIGIGEGWSPPPAHADRTNEMEELKNLIRNEIGNGLRNNQKALTLLRNMLFRFHNPIYRWNASDCHAAIVINESHQSIQCGEAMGNNSVDWSYRSCRAGPIITPMQHIGIIYAEYLLIHDKHIQIGLSSKTMPLDSAVGLRPGSYAYSPYGFLYGKTADGNKTDIHKNIPSFDVGDVAGCGLNLATREAFFTKNGQRLNNAKLYVDSVDLFPTVTLGNPHAMVMANFGPNFNYDLSREYDVDEK